MYAYGDQAYAMYEKAPENINVTFPVINGVIADYANMQTMIFEFLEKYSKGKVRGAEFVVAVPTDITAVSYTHLSEIKGLYPCGEGAGYAGGIMSAAMDGIKIAEMIAKQYAPGK